MKTENEIWAQVINDARWYDGTPQTLTKMIDHFKEYYKVECKVKKLSKADVIKSVCDVCGSDDIIEAPHMGKNCTRCHPI